MVATNTHKKGGFTLVELLIVIVVIAILAAISIVAYNGITQRANNSHMITAAKTYQQALMQYRTVHDAYPTTADYYYGVCLGNGYEGGHCWRGPNGNYYVNDEFDELLEEFVDTEPNVPTKFHAVSSQDSRSGVVYYRNNPTGRQSIEYLLDGRNQSCSLSGAVASNIANNTATRCQLTLPAL